MLCIIENISLILFTTISYLTGFFSGMILNFLIGVTARGLTKNEKRKMYETHEELANPYTETETTPELPDHLTAM